MLKNNGQIRKSDRVKECPVCHSDFLIVTSKTVYLSIRKEDKLSCCLISCGECGRIKGVIQDKFATYRKIRRKAIEDWNNSITPMWRNKLNCMAHK